MANVTTTTAAVFLPTLWSIETLRAAESALVAAGLVKRYDALVKAKGQAIKIPLISNLSVTAKSANTDVTTQTVTEDTVTLNVNTWYESSFEIEDMVAVQSNYKSKDIVASDSNVCRKQGEFGEHPFGTIPSRASQEEGVETMYLVPQWGNDIVRAYA